LASTDPPLAVLSSVRDLFGGRLSDSKGSWKPSRADRRSPLQLPTFESAELSLFP